MLDNLKKILNEDQDPKAIDKISEKLIDLLMKNEEVGYIAVQKKPALTVFPDSIVLTDKRIIICSPKNLGLSMSFTDYDWELVVAPLIKEGLLGSEFSFVTKTDITVTMDYLPKNQARRLYTFAKEQLELRRNPPATAPLEETPQSIFSEEYETKVEEIAPALVEDVIEAEEVTDFTSFYQEPPQIVESNQLIVNVAEVLDENPTSETKQKTLDQLTKEELFEKLQNYKKLLDNGLILQGEYDTLKHEIIKHM